VGKFFVFFTDIFYFRITKILPLFLFLFFFALFCSAINFFHAVCQFCLRAQRARRRAIYAPPELKISAHGNALKQNNFYYTKALLNIFN